MRLPELFDLKTNQPEISVAAIFRQRYTIRVVQLYMWETRYKSVAQLHKVTNVDQGLACLAD